MHGVFEEFAERQAGDAMRWPRIPYDEAIRKYGTDKPDLRNPIEMQDVSEHFRGSGFKVFARHAGGRRRTQSGRSRRRAAASRAFCDRMNAWAQGEGQPGLGYIFWREGERGRRRPDRQEHRRRSAPRRSATQLGLEDGDAAFFVAGDPDKILQVRRRWRAPRSARS